MQRRPAATVWMAASVLVLSVGLPAALLAEVPDIERSRAWVLTTLVMVWAGIRLSVIWVRGVPALFEFFFWLFAYIFMGVAPTAQLRSGEISTTTSGIDPALDMPTALIVVGGLASYEVGRLMWRALRRRDAVHGEPAVAVSAPRSIVLMGAGLLFGAYFLAKVGVGAALGSRAAAFAARNAAWPDPSMRAVFYALAIYPMLVAVGALVQIRRDASGMRRATHTVMIAIGLMVLMAIVSPISSARYTFGTVAFALVAYLGALRTAGRARITMLGTLAGFLFVFPLADAFRTDEVRLTRSGFFQEYLGNPDYDAFWQIANAYSYTVDGLVEPGRQLLGSMFFWVPRSIWPDKPIDTGALLAQYRGYSFDNLSAPLWAELLVNGGVVAVVVGFLVIGALLAAMDRKVGPTFASSGWWAIVGAILPVYMTILLRGSLLQATGSIAVAMACLLWVRRAPTRSAAPETRRSPPS